MHTVYMSLYPNSYENDGIIYDLYNHDHLLWQRIRHFLTLQNSNNKAFLSDISNKNHNTTGYPQCQTNVIRSQKLM